jgi:hypothetical protein
MAPPILLLCIWRVGGVVEGAALRLDAVAGVCQRVLGPPPSCVQHTCLCLPGYSTWVLQCRLSALSCSAQWLSSRDSCQPAPCMTLHLGTAGAAPSAAIARACRRVAIEVDGPRHFTANTPHRALGRTLARLRCLELRGVRVVSIPFFEWSQLHCHEQRVQYLTAALDGSVWRTALLGTSIGGASCIAAC